MTLSSSPARASQDDEPCVLELGLCIDCVDEGECRAERPVVVPLPYTPALSSLLIWPQLLCLKRQHGALKEDGQHVAARATKEQAIGLVEGWFDGANEDWLDGAERLDLMAAARAHISATLARVQLEIAEGAPF